MPRAAAWLRPFALAGLLLACLAPGVRAEDEKPAADPTKDPALLAFFDAFRDRAVAGDREAIAGMFDTDAMIAAIESTGLVRVAEARRAAFRAAMARGLALMLRRPTTAPAFKTYRITKVTTEGTDRLVVLMHVDPGGADMTILRWFLTRRDDSFAIVDFEALETAIRFVPLIGTLLADMHGGVPEEWRGAGPALQHAVGLTMREDYEGARDAWLGLIERALPDALQSLCEVALAACLTALGEFEEALPHLDAAQRMAPDMPLQWQLRATVLNALERHEEALAAANRYIALLEPLPAARLQAAIALYFLERRDEALAHLRPAADGAPQDVDILAFLLLALPEGDHNGFKRRFAKLEDPEAAAVDILEFLLEEENRPAMQALADALESVRPGAPYVAFTRGHAAVDPGAAGEFFKAARDQALRAQLSIEWVEVYDETLVDAYLDAHGAAQAYAVAFDKARALHQIGNEVAPMRHEADLDMAALGALLGAVAKEPVKDAGEPEQLRLGFLEAELLHRAGNDAEVVKRLTPLLARVDAAMAKADEESLAYDRLEDILYRVEDRLIRALLRTKQLDTARPRAQRIATRDHDHLYAVMTLVFDGKAEAAIARMRVALEEGAEPFEFFEDPDLEKPLAGKAYAAFRDEIYED